MNWLVISLRDPGALAAPASKGSGERGRVRIAAASGPVHLVAGGTRHRGPGGDAGQPAGVPGEPVGPLAGQGVATVFTADGPIATTAVTP